MRFSLVLLLGGILVLGFYWFQVRPTQVRKACYEELGGRLYYSDVDSKSIADSEYRMCFIRHGLKAEPFSYQVNNE